MSRVFQVLTFIFGGLGVISTIIAGGERRICGVSGVTSWHGCYLFLSLCSQQAF